MYTNLYPLIKNAEGRKMVKQGGSKKPTLMKSAIMINALLGGALSFNVMADTIWQENFEASALQDK